MTLEEKLNARSLTNTYPEHYGKIIPYDDLIKIKDALEIFQQQVSVEPEVMVNFAEVRELIDAMIIDMNGWEPIVNDYDKGFDKGYKNALTTLKEDISKISA